MFYRNRQKLAQ